MTTTPSLVIGSIVDMAGIARAKAVPASRLGSFTRTGMGASPSWNVFCTDDQIAFTDTFSVAGDLRLRIDEAELRDLGGDVSWAPATMFDQTGTTAPACTRSVLKRTVDRTREAGFEAMVGHEIEFMLDDALPAGRWSAYGLGAALDVAEFTKNLMSAAARADLPVEQFHAEYGSNQFEISLAPADPVAAADNMMLARILISRTARAHNLLASFSPVPAVGGSGNGAHQHLSLTRDDVPILSTGSGVHGLTDEGASAIAGVVAHLADLMAVLASSPLSHIRLRPGTWSGAYCCWGLENREAAVRFCAATPGNPYGANLEVKVVDPSANPYLSTAVILGASLSGIEESTPLPQEVLVNPSTMSESERTDAAIALVPTDIPDVLARLRASSVAKETLGDAVIEAIVAVREREYRTFEDMDNADIATRFRYAWTL